MDTNTLHRMWETRPVRLSAHGKIAGVCAGIAARYRIDPLLVRVAFVVAFFFGGAALPLYLAGWLFLREEGDELSAGEALFSDRRSSMGSTGAVLLLIALIATGAGAIGTMFDVLGAFALALILFSVAWWFLHQRTPEAPPQTSPAGAPEWTPETPAAPLPTTTSGPGDHADLDPTLPPVPAADVPDSVAFGADPGGRDPGDVAPATSAAESGEPGPGRRSGYTFAVYVIAAAVAGVLVVLTRTSDLIDLGGFAIAAIALGVLVLGLAVGLVLRTGFGLIPGIITLGGALLLAVFTGLSSGFTGGIGEITESPVTASDLRDDYRRGVGTIDLDLRGLHLDGDRRVEAGVGIGEVRVHVPSDMRVRVSCRSGIGETDCIGSTSDTRGGPLLTIDASTGIGTVRVIRG